MPEPMSERITLYVNGSPVVVREGTTIAAAILRAGNAAFRRSVTGESRGPLCGMGICFECRVTVNGNRYVRSCQVLCSPGMDVRTDEQARISMNKQRLTC